MLNRMVRQLEIAGQELAPFIQYSGSVRPLGSKGKWRAKLLRLPQADEVIDIIEDAVEKAPDPDMIPFKINWRDMLGRVEVDTSNKAVYIVYVEKMAMA